VIWGIAACWTTGARWNVDVKFGRDPVCWAKVLEALPPRKVLVKGFVTWEETRVMRRPQSARVEMCFIITKICLEELILTKGYKIQN